MTKFNWEQNILYASKANNLKDAEREWLNKGLIDIRGKYNCVCGSVLTSNNKYYLYNPLTGHKVIAGASCQKKIPKQFKPDTKPSGNIKSNFEKVEYSDLNMDQYLAKCFKDIDVIEAKQRQIEIEVERQKQKAIEEAKQRQIELERRLEIKAEKERLERQRQAEIELQRQKQKAIEEEHKKVKEQYLKILKEKNSRKRDMIYNKVRLEAMKLLNIKNQIDSLPLQHLINTMIQWDRIKWIEYYEQHQLLKIEDAIIYGNKMFKQCQSVKK